MVRKGAVATYVEPWHMDMYDYIELRKNAGEERRRAHDIFLALWLNDLFMERASKDEDWALFDPYDTPDLTNLYGEAFNERYRYYEQDETIRKKTVSAKTLWKAILREYFETGMPFLTFKDRANETNPNSHKGIIRSSNLCVTGDTRLHTQYGIIKAKELYERYGEIEATYDKRTDGQKDGYGVSKAKALRMFKTKENADIYKIITEHGYEIKSTDWHEYYVEENNKINKKPLKDVKIGDKLLLQSGEGQFGYDGSYQLGVILGLTTGDGTFSISNKNESNVHIDLYNEAIVLHDDVISYLNTLISDFHNRLSKVNKIRFLSYERRIIPHTDNSRKVRISSSIVGRILDEVFGYHKETKLIVPDVVFKGLRETVKGYLQGLFTTDGTINPIRSDKQNDSYDSFSIQLSSISERLLKDVQILLMNFGIRSKVFQTKDYNSTRFTYTTVNGEEREYISKPLYRLDINGNNAIVFIKEIGFLTTKQRKAEYIINERFAKYGRKYSNKKEKFVSRIVDIVPIGKEDVYDTTQLYNHSLIFNGIVTGNCTEIFQNTEPDTFLVKVTLEDGTTHLFDENTEVVVTLGEKAIVKKAKKIGTLDTIDGVKVEYVEREKVDGKTAVCNLASINLSKVNTKEDIERVVPTVIRMLDNVVDLNFYPIPKVKKSNRLTRAIGMGVMGESEMLASQQIHWGSQEHFNKIDEVMEMISYNAIKASVDLGKEKGVYKEFEGSLWSRGILPMDHVRKTVNDLITRQYYVYDWDKLRQEVKKGMRNGYLMAIAPTSSISIFTGTTQAIEPIYKKKWYEENLSGMIPNVVPNLTLDTINYYVSAYDMDPVKLVKAAAIRQGWVDQGQSLNIFLPLEKAKGRVLNEVYTTGWKLGLKSFYYLRTQSPEALEEAVDDSGKILCNSCQ